jgi:hypothetical protein
VGLVREKEATGRGGRAVFTWVTTRSSLLEFNGVCWVEMVGIGTEFIMRYPRKMMPDALLHIHISSI